MLKSPAKLKQMLAKTEGFSKEDMEKQAAELEKQVKEANGEADEEEEEKTPPPEYVVNSTNITDNEYKHERYIKYCLEASKSEDLSTDQARARYVKIRLDHVYGSFHAVIVGSQMDLADIDGEEESVMDLQIGETRYVMWYPKIEKKEEWKRGIKVLWDMYNPDNSPLMDQEESRKFFDAVAKRWKMLKLEPGDRGYKKML